MNRPTWSIEVTAVDGAPPPLAEDDPMGYPGRTWLAAVREWLLSSDWETIDTFEAVVRSASEGRTILLRAERDGGGWIVRRPLIGTRHYVRPPGD